MSESISFTSRSLTLSPTRNLQSIAWTTAPVSRSMRFQRMFAGVDPADVDHVVLPLDPAGVRVLPVAVVGVLVPVLAVGGMLAVARGLRDELRGKDFIPHSGQWSGASRTTSGCMGQT